MFWEQNKCKDQQELKEEDEFINKRNVVVLQELQNEEGEKEVEKEEEGEKEEEEED